MSDATVTAALRSKASLVVIEAPGGCGKTHQGASYAVDAAKDAVGRILILTHTHAACDVFATRTTGTGGRVEIRTIDSIVGEIAGAYHLSIDLPPDVGAWARANEDGYNQIAIRVARLLSTKPIVASALARRYPLIICDEHQDATPTQEEIVLALYKAGSNLRVFADPMQRIFAGRTKAAIDAEIKRWADLKDQADEFDELDTPHRWNDTNPALGQWILEARATLRDGGQINLTGALPQGLRVIRADNIARNPRQYQISAQHRGPLNQVLQPLASVLVLASHNDTVSSLRAFFGRTMPIWEGHTRDTLDVLCSAMQEHCGNAVEIAKAATGFASAVATGFSPSAYTKALIQEVEEGCAKRRTKKPASIQGLAKKLFDQPNHRGVAAFLTDLKTLSRDDAAFADVLIDHPREFNDAVHLAKFDEIDAGVSELSRRRAHIRARLPARAISTIHKAKGLEFPHVVLAGCDRTHFANSAAARARLYVAMSRATVSLTLMVSHIAPTPLLQI